MIPPFIPDIPVSTPLTITIDMQISYFSDVECRYDILLILKLLTCRDRLNTLSWTNQDRENGEGMDERLKLEQGRRLTIQNNDKYAHAETIILLKIILQVYAAYSDLNALDNDASITAS